VSPVDLGLVVLLLLAAFLGYRRGAILQLFTYGGLLVGIVAGALLAPVTAGATNDLAAQAGIAVATLLIAAGIGDLVGWLLGGRLRARARSSRLGRADSAGGSLVALTATVLAIWLVSFSLGNGPLGVVADQIQRSAVIRGIDDALPQPPSILGEVRRFFNAVGFPDVFAGLPPLPADPVAPPAQATARRAFRAADESTVRIVGQACGRIQQGSGFAADGGLIVTNAHVVAGERTTRVQRSTTSDEATVVLFDPGVDIAILRVGAGQGGGLALVRDVVARGAGGAVVGYPGGGPLTGTRAETSTARARFAAVCTSCRRPSYPATPGVPSCCPTAASPALWFPPRPPTRSSDTRSRRPTSSRCSTARSTARRPFRPDPACADTAARPS
jgi:S1-C subfamily serine protease